MSNPQNIIIEDLRNVRRVNPRDLPDLPKEITGEGAIWVQEKKSPCGQVIPPSYYALSDQDWYPLEFINNKWYWIEWDDSDKYKGYWVKPDLEIVDPGALNLGWMGKPMESVTP